MVLSLTLPTSFARSMIFRWPSASKNPASPVWTQPSPVLVSRVASSFLKYPMKTPGLRNITSPSSVIRISTSLAGTPTVSGLTWPSGWMVMKMEASVEP